MPPSELTLAYPAREKRAEAWKGDVEHLLKTDETVAPNECMDAYSCRPLMERPNDRAIERSSDRSTERPSDLPTPSDRTIERPIRTRAFQPFV